METNREDIARALRDKAHREGEKLKIPCEAAHSIADGFGVPRREIGAVCEEEGIRICACQLGCFP